MEYIKQWQQTKKKTKHRLNSTAAQINFPPPSETR